MSKHTPGPWDYYLEPSDHYKHKIRSKPGLICQLPGWVTHGELRLEQEANARLIVVAPELLQALHECIDSLWVIDSHAVEFDGTVHFGPYYDFSGLDGADRHEFLAEHSCVVWPSGGKWSAYCTYKGSTWFEAFCSADEAKETCMKLLDKVMPTHPAMKARAAIAKATGEHHDN